MRIAVALHQERIKTRAARSSLASDRQASDRWALRSGGEYDGVGAGVGISGFRADLGSGDDFFEWIEAFCSLVREWKPREWAEEQGQIKAGVGPFIERMQRERQAFVYRRTFPTRGDKAVRAQSIRGRMARRGLYVPQNSPWIANLRSELLSFPTGKHDDQVDALGLIGQLLDTISTGSRPEPVPSRPVDSGYRAYDLAGGRMNDWMAI